MRTLTKQELMVERWYDSNNRFPTNAIIDESNEVLKALESWFQKCD